MAQPPSPAKQAANPRVAKLIELETRGVIKPEHLQELNTYRAQGLAPISAGASATESERKASAFLSRALGSNTSYEATGVGPRSLVGQAMADSVPNLLNSLPAIVGNSDDRQVSDSAQEEFIAASLRQDSGAAIPPEEMARQRRIYFPMPGDEEAAKAQKRAARLRALDGLFQSAGRSVTPAQRAEFEKLRADVDAAMKGEAPPPNDAVPADPADKERLGLLDAPAAVVDVATEVRGGPLEIGIGNPSSGQSAEFRAGLNVLLDDPKTTKEQILEYWDKNAPGALEKGADPKPAPLASGRGVDPNFENIDATVRGAADIVTLGLATRGAALADTVANGGTYRENLDRQRGVDIYDAEVNPWARGVGQLAGAFAIPTRAAAAGARAEASALTAGKTAQEARIAARYGVAKRMGLEGGGIGAAYGFNSEYGNWGEKAKSGIMGLAGGGAVGYGLGRLVGAVGNRADIGSPDGGGSTRAKEAADLAAAATDLDIDLMPADAGGPVTRLMTTAAAATPGGVQPIVNAARRSQEQGSAALGKMAAREGEVLTPEGAGEAVRDGALAYRDSSRAAIGKDYARAAELAGDARVEPKGAIERLDQEIAELEEIPGGTAGLSMMKGLRDDLAQRGTVTIQGIRGMRTQLRDQFFKDGLRGSDLERRVNGVIDAASDDLIASLRAAGKEEAANVYAAADKAWAQRVKTLDEVIMPIIGKKGEKSGEQIIAGINAAAKGNNARLVRLFDALPADEAGNARATLIDGLGKASPGQQNAAGDTFSFDTFLTNWNKLGASAKNTFFQGENRKAIDQLALIAEKSKAAGRFRNFSNTGMAFGGLATTGTIAAGLFPFIATVAAQYGAGRLLASPRTARALLNIAKAGNPQAARTRIQALSSVAAKDPTVREPLIALQQKLLNAINDNAGTSGSVAASPNERPEQ